MKIDSKARHVMRLTKGVRYCTESLEFAGWGRYSEMSPSAVGMAPISFFDDEGTFFGPDLTGVEPLFLMDSVVVRGVGDETRAGEAGNRSQGGEVMEVDEIRKRQAAHELIHKTAIDIRKMIDYAVSETSVINDDVEELIRELVFD